MNRKSHLVGIMLCIYVLILPLIPNNLSLKGIGIKGDYVLLILFLSYGLNLIINREARKTFINGIKASFRDLIFILMIIIFIVMTLSTTYAVDKSIAISESLRFLTYILVYFIIKCEIKTEKVVNGVLNSYVIATFIVSAFGIIQYFTRIGLDEKFIYNRATYSVDLRITSTLDNSNTLGAYLMIAIFPLIMLGIYERKRSKKVKYIASSVLVLITIILTFSRNAWLGIMIGFILLVLIYNWRFIIVLICGIAGSALLPQVRSRAVDFKVVFKDPRVNVWKLAVNMIKEHPIFGVGNGNFYYQYGEYIKKYPKLMYNSYTNFQVHNSYLKVFSELGFIGLVPFVSLIILILSTLKNTLRKLGQGKIKSFYNGFYISVIVFVLMNIPDNLFFVPKLTMNFWILIAISQAIIYNKIYVK